MSPRDDKPGRVCRQAREWFLRSEERRLAPAEQLRMRAHLAQCAACRDEWARWQAEDRLLREALRPVPAPRDLAAEALAALRQRKARPRRRRPRWAVAGLAAAAAVLLAVLAGVLWRPRRYERVGQVAAMTGQPLVAQRGASFPSAIEAGVAVYDGAALFTGRGESLAVDFADGSRLTLSAGTEAQLSGQAARRSCGHLLPHVCLRRGEVVCNLKSLRYFRAVGTPLGTAIVAGTEFRIRYVEGVRTELEVLEGEVRFSSPYGEARAPEGTVWVITAAEGVPRQVGGAAVP